MKPSTKAGSASGPWPLAMSVNLAMISASDGLSVSKMGGEYLATLRTERL